MSPAPAGYIRLYRKLLENPVWTQLSPVVLKVWIGCLLRANWKPSSWYDGQNQVPIPAGAFAFSQDSLSKLCRVSRQELRTALSHLANLKILTIRSTKRYSLITLENWSTYQSEMGALNQTSTKDQPTINQDLTTEEEYKNINNYTGSSPEGGAGAPLVLVSNSDRKAPAQKKRRPYQDVLEQVARSIHERHPNNSEYERRDLGVAGVEKKLGAILKRKHVAAAECEAYLRRIDQIHAANCASEKWQKDDGQWAKSLRNYLAPAEERYEVEPSEAARKEPVRLMA